MAESPNKIRKPRIRKTAPTVREKVEAAQAKANREKPKRLAKLTKRLPKPHKRFHLHLPNNKLTRILSTVFRFIGRVLRKLAPRYFVNSWREVRQVTWPNRRETWRLTGAVLVFSIVFGALVAGVDKGLDEIFKHFVLK